MNAKELFELMKYLTDRRNERADMRNYYQQRYSDLLEQNQEKDAEYYKNAASEAGMEVSRLDYFLRTIGQIEVTR